MSLSESEHLADTFASIAREMDAAASPEETQDVVTRRAVDVVPGCVHAGLTLIRRDGSVTTVAATGEVAERIHVLQNELGEGPCLSAIHDHAVYTVDDLQHDPRWPRFASRIAAEAPVASMLAFRLFTSQDTTGALDLYAERPHAFDAHSRVVGTVLAAHAAIAMVAARERENAANLETALHSSREIGIAIGIVMHSRRLGRDQAFAFLADASQRLNRKLRDVARAIAEAGEIPSGTGDR